MFTGLIEDVGTIGVLRLENNAAVLTVKTNLPVHSMPRGASVAVNGACLTVVRKSSKTFTVDVSPETLQRTNLETLAVGSSVNLERPMRLADRLGGHLVTGHVDGLGTIARQAPVERHQVEREQHPSSSAPSRPLRRPGQPSLPCAR